MAHNNVDKSRGALFPRNKTSQNAPDMGGEIVIRTEVLEHIIQQAQMNGMNEVELRLAAWRGRSRSGISMLTISLEVPREQEPQQQARQGGYPNRGAPQRQQYAQQGGQRYNQAPVQQGNSYANARDSNFQPAQQRPVQRPQEPDLMEEIPPWE